jgi:pectinesterase
MLRAITALLALLWAQASDATTVQVGHNLKVGYASVQAAVDALPETGGTVEIAAGTYREKLVIAKSNVKLVGTSKKPEDVVLVWGDSHISAGGTGKSASVWASGDGFEAHNLTIQNDYHLHNAEKSQAVALRLTADRAVLTNVRLLGAQDTLYAASKSPDSPSRQYFRDCYIEGHVDFIFGDAKAFFDRCHIHGIANDIVMITAQSKVKPEQDSGYVFDRCRITADGHYRHLQDRDVSRISIHGAGREQRDARPFEPAAHESRDEGVVIEKISRRYGRLAPLTHASFCRASGHNGAPKWTVSSMSGVTLPPQCRSASHS